MARAIRNRSSSSNCETGRTSMRLSTVVDAVDASHAALDVVPLVRHRDRTVEHDATLVDRRFDVVENRELRVAIHLVRDVAEDSAGPCVPARMPRWPRTTQAQSAWGLPSSTWEYSFETSPEKQTQTTSTATRVPSETRCHASFVDFGEWTLAGMIRLEPCRPHGFQR